MRRVLHRSQLTSVRRRCESGTRRLAGFFSLPVGPVGSMLERRGVAASVNGLTSYRKQNLQKCSVYLPEKDASAKGDSNGGEDRRGELG